MTFLLINDEITFLQLLGIITVYEEVWNMSDFKEKNANKIRKYEN